jgi:hypothetical protein
LKTRFQNLLSKCNLHRYIGVEMGALEEATSALLVWIKNRNLQGGAVQVETS